MYHAEKLLDIFNLKNSERVDICLENTYNNIMSKKERMEVPEVKIVLKTNIFTNLLVKYRYRRRKIYKR